jgi:hypothetical protein
VYLGFKWVITAGFASMKAGILPLRKDGLFAEGAASSMGLCGFTSAPSRVVQGDSECIIVDLPQVCHLIIHIIDKPQKQSFPLMRVAFFRL